MTNGHLNEKELSILSIAERIPEKFPSEKQCQVLVESLERLLGEGCPVGEDVIPSDI